MTVVIALANQKGGVGKTTTTISLGAALAARGWSTLVIDADPQANATSALGESRAEATGLYDALIDDAPLEATIVAASTAGLSLLPAAPSLAGVEVELVTLMAREFRLKRALEPLRGRYDTILVDCPPSLGLLTVNALAAADEVMIPVQCEYFALEGLTHLLATVDLVKRNLNPALTVRGLVLTMFDGRTNLAREVEHEVRTHFANTFRTVIPRSVRLSEAPSHGEPIQRYDPDSSGARAYEALADELVAQLRPPPVEAPELRPTVVTGTDGGEVAAGLTAGVTNHIAGNGNGDGDGTTGEVARSGTGGVYGGSHGT